MKPFLSLLLALLLTLSACGQTPFDGQAATQQAQSPSSGNADVEKPLPSAKPAETQTAPNSSGTANSSIVDLTVLSSTMVYVEVFNMLSSPENYIGKTVKMHGQFSTGKLYAQDGSLSDGGIVFACIIQDAAACCAQGIPFALSDESASYPEDYPALGDSITVIGTFELHEENGLSYCRLKDAEMTA